MAVEGDYILFGNLEEKEVYLICLSSQKYKELDLPISLENGIDMCFSIDGKALFLTNGNDGYWLDITKVVEDEE